MKHLNTIDSLPYIDYDQSDLAKEKRAIRLNNFLRSETYYIELGRICAVIIRKLAYVLFLVSWYGLAYTIKGLVIAFIYIEFGAEWSIKKLMAKIKTPAN